MYRSPILNAIIPIILVLPLITIGSQFVAWILYFVFWFLLCTWLKDFFLLKSKGKTIQSILIISGAVITVSLNSRTKNTSFSEVTTTREIYAKAFCLQNPQPLKNYINGLSHSIRVKIVNCPKINENLIGSVFYCTIDNTLDTKSLVRGDIISFKGIIQGQEKKGFSKIIRIKKFSIHKKNVSLYQNLLSSARNTYYSKITSSERLSKGAKGFLLAFTSGNKSFLSDEQINTFRNSGTIHLFAVSGLHVGLFYLIIRFFLGLIIWNIRFAVMVSLFSLLIYVDFVNSPPSAIRAFIMIFFWEFSKIVYRKTNSVSSLSWAFLVVVLLDPKEFYSIGFQLSFCVVLSMVWLIRRRFDYEKPVLSLMRKWISSIIVSYACFWGSFWALISTFKLFIPISIITNSFIVPLAMPIMFLSILFCFLLTAFGIEMAWMIDYPYLLINYILKMISFSKIGYYEVSLDINNVLSILIVLFLIFTINRFESFKLRLIVIALLNIQVLVIGIFFSF